MNPIETLADDLRKRFPESSVKIDAPIDPAGLWHLDVESANGHWVVIEWKPGEWFGVSTPGPDDFFEKPDELYVTPKEVYDRVTQLVLAVGKTVPPTPAQLAELRALRALSRAELAETGDFPRPDVSRIEARDDILLSTLLKLLGAMGARLSLRVTLPSGEAHEMELSRPAGDGSTTATMPAPSPRRRAAPKPKPVAAAGGGVAGETARKATPAPRPPEKKRARRAAGA